MIYDLSILDYPDKCIIKCDEVKLEEEKTSFLNHQKREKEEFPKQTNDLKIQQNLINYVFLLKTEEQRVR